MTKKNTITQSQDFAPRTNDEIETHVLYGRDKTMTIYTSDPIEIRHLDKKYSRSREIMDNGKVFAVEYVVDKALLTFRTKKRTSTMTDEQRQKARERMKLIKAKAPAL